MEEELELTTDGSDIFITRKSEPFVICAISLTSAAVKAEGEFHCFEFLFCSGKSRETQNHAKTPVYMEHGIAD